MDKEPNMKKMAKEKEFEKFYKAFKNLKINLCFVGALAHIPKYAKFLKELVTSKKKLDVS